MKVYNVGIVGFGFIGKVHCLRLPELAVVLRSGSAPRTNHARRYRPVGDCRKSPADGRRRRGGHRLPCRYREPEDRHRPHLHAEPPAQGCSAVGHPPQKHIYCDKPLVASLDEADEVEAALAGYRGTAQMTFKTAFFPPRCGPSSSSSKGALGRDLEFPRLLPARRQLRP